MFEIPKMIPPSSIATNVLEGYKEVARGEYLALSQCPPPHFPLPLPTPPTLLNTCVFAESLINYDYDEINKIADPY
jgi:hypothetical protein